MLELDENIIQELNNTEFLGIYLHHQMGKFIYVNQAFASFIGCSREELLSRYNLLDLIHEKYKQEVCDTIKRRNNGEVLTKEFQEILYVTKDGFLRPAMNFGYTVDFKGQPAGLVLVVDTLRRKINELLLKALSGISFAQYENFNEHEILEHIAKVLGNVEDINAATIIEYNEESKIVYTSNPNLAQLHRDIVEKTSNLSEIIMDTVQGSSTVCVIPIATEKKIYLLVMQSRIKDIFTISDRLFTKSIRNLINVLLEKTKISKFNRILTQAINSSLDLVLIMNNEFKVEYSSKPIIESFGVDEKQLIERLSSLIKREKNSKDITTFLQLEKQGNVKQLLAHITHTELEKEYFIVTLNDITENKQFQLAMDNFLKKDQLTGLMNRRAFLSSVERFVKRAKHRQLLGAVIVIDPRNFSKINQAFGLQTGDKILMQIAERILSFLRDYDVIARLESERFAILLKEILREEDIYIIAVRLMEILKKPYEIGNLDIHLNFNMGVSIYPLDSDLPEDLLDKAELALVDAKLSGAGIGFFKESLRLSAKKHIEIQEDFPKALKNGEIKLYLQPYFDTEARNVRGAEALVRWIKEERTISPMEFVPILEQTLLIKDLDKYMTEQAMKFVESSPIKMPVSVNVSSQSLYDDLFIDFITYQTKERWLEGLINVEIIERTVLDNIESAKQNLDKLKKNGIGVAVDDFGTGYSSLSYLAQLPVDYVKIDISFVRKMVTDTKVLSVVKTIIYLAKELGAKTIAEGVETEKQIEILKSLGCNYLQGFYFSKPIPHTQFQIFSTRV